MSLLIYPVFDGRQPVIDVDLGLGREYGYRDIRAVAIVSDGQPPPPGTVLCHPDEPYYALNKCQSCYRRAYAAARAAVTPPISGGAS